MKKTLIFISTLLLFGCSKSNINNSNCRFLLNVNVNLLLPLSLPQYSQLQFAGNSVIEPGGNKGVIVIFTGTDYLAWDAGDPNHAPSSCSALQVSDFQATCGCTDANEYSLLTGQPLSDPSLPCGLKPYRVELIGNDLVITN
ncbi:hypothetical protein U0L90_01545 [Flavobacteriaceae sp. LMIT009]